MKKNESFFANFIIGFIIGKILKSIFSRKTV